MPGDDEILTGGLSSGDDTALLTGGLDSGATNGGGGNGNGGGSGGTTEVVVLIRGPLRLRSNGRISEEGYVGDTIPLLLSFEDDFGSRLSLDGANLTWNLSQYGSQVDDGIVSASDVGSLEQLFRLNVPLPATQGVARLTVTRQAGANDKQSAEILINVKPK